MLAEQAIFTSLVRHGRSGYHLVARSPGVTEPEAVALATWSPSHGGLVVDAANRASVNFHPLPGGRFALARTLEGGPEPSGRGGRRVHTHALVIDSAKLRQAGFQPFAVYRDALALGYYRYRADPEPALAPVCLSTLYPGRSFGPFSVPRDDPESPEIEAAVARLEAGEAVTFPHGGDRAALAERLIGRLPGDTVARLSFSTSLRASAVRPYRLTLTAEG